MGTHSIGNTAEYQRRICRAIDFINVHLAENPSVAEIARAAPFSTFHFQRLFRAILGETVAEFTRRLRLESAARNLRYQNSQNQGRSCATGDRHALASKRDITELAFELGFSSSQNFAKAFKKHFGMSPSQYREHVGVELEDSSRIDTEVNHRHEVESLIRPDGTETNSIVQSVEIRNLSSCRVVYWRHFGSYDDHGVQAAFDNLVRWAKAREIDRLDRYLGIPWDDSDVTHKDKCRFDACVILPDDLRVEGGVNLQTIPAGRYAVHRSQVVMNDFDVPWTQLMRDWLPASGFQPADGPRFEKYLSDGSNDPDGVWQMEAFLPVKPL